MSSFVIFDQLNKLGEYNPKVAVRKEMTISALWCEKPPIMNIYIKEYQLYKIPARDELVTKRRLLCQSQFNFFEDLEQDSLQKCELTITDDLNSLCFRKLYSQIDCINRKFFTNQLSVSYYYTNVY